MRISRFYYNGPLSKDTIVKLCEETSHYILHVLRLKVGAKSVLFNGDGKDYLAILTDCSKKIVTLEIQESINVHKESPLKIHLVQGISRGEKMDWTIQKAVELGVTEITPIITEHCSIKLDASRREKRLVHWQKIMVSACEQSGRSSLPSLNPIVQFEDWIYHPRQEMKLFCDPNSSQRLSHLPAAQEILLIIGPEGGLSNNEISLANKYNFTGISLGPRILRTETAAVSAISVAQALWGDL
ncbi:MAG: 16S rRNA (uracil(1498)-N(3))-methyltransferase [Gammaproteobacteria bacterium]|nr:16S rRNA (uracil(1498)-N(3))-methyltransferase [Gammaproteobacteria bacterium]